MKSDVIKKIAMCALAICGMVVTCFATDYYWRCTTPDTSIVNSGGKSGNGGDLANWNVKEGGNYVAATQLPQGG